MRLMSDRKGLVIGIANDRSYAWHIANSLRREGAELFFTHLPGEKMERRVRSAVEELSIPVPWLRPLEATNEDQMHSVFAEAAEAAGGRLDFLVHSIAFADREYLEAGRFIDTPRDAFLQAVEISAYTLLSMARAVRPYMTGGGSILAMTYYGSEKVVPGYNVMGVAKATLESTCRYLAAELGRGPQSHSNATGVPCNPGGSIRVNTISGGPLKTLSAMGVGGFTTMLDHVASKTPLGRNIEGGEVGDTACWLLSDRSAGVTGQCIYVDAGYSIMGM